MLYLRHGFGVSGRSGGSRSAVSVEASRSYTLCPCYTCIIYACLILFTYYLCVYVYFGSHSVLVCVCWDCLSRLCWCGPWMWMWVCAFVCKCVAIRFVVACVCINENMMSKQTWDNACTFRMRLSEGLPLWMGVARLYGGRYVKSVIGSCVFWVRAWVYLTNILLALSGGRSRRNRASINCLANLCGILTCISCATTTEMPITITISHRKS